MAISRMGGNEKWKKEEEEVGGEWATINAEDLHTFLSVPPVPPRTPLAA